MNEQEILRYLIANGAILQGHFVYTSGLHGVKYLDVRQVAHDSVWMWSAAKGLSDAFKPYEPQLLVGPETLGRDLARLGAPGIGCGHAVWCETVEEGGRKWVIWPRKLPHFSEVVRGKQVGIVDDLLTTGGSIRRVAELVQQSGGHPVSAAVIVRRQPEITAAACGVEHLAVLADVTGFSTFTPEECERTGPCSRRVPMKLRPGHGWKWIKNNPGYPVAA